jgi:capsular exopolysaccharide synthesis family protein
MNVAEYWKIARRWWWLPVIGLVLCGVAGYAASTRQTAMYQASSTILVNQVQSPGPAGYNDVLTSERLASTYTQLLQSASLRDEVIAQLELPLTADTLKKRTKVAPVRATQLVGIDVQDTDPGRATAIANTLAQVFIRHAQEIQTSNVQTALAQVNGNIAAVQTQITDLSNQMNGLRASIDQSSATAAEIQRLQTVLSGYDYDLRTIRETAADVSSRLNQLRTTPDPTGASQPEIQRLQDQFNQLNQDQKDIQQKYTDTSAQLDRLRAAPIAGSAAAGQAAHLQDQIAQAQDRYRQLLDSQQSIMIAQAQSMAATSVADTARVPGKPIAPRLLRDGALAGALGLLLFAALALILDSRDDRAHDMKEITQRFGVPVYGAFGVRRGGKALLLTNSDLANLDAFREVIRNVRTRLIADAPKGNIAVCVSSARAGEGKSTIAANLAMIEAQAGKRVVLLDADVRNAGIHRLLGLRNNQGLSAWLARKQHGDTPKLQQGPYGITVLTAGWVLSNLPDLLGSRRMEDLIEGLRREYDIIVLDSPPILGTADALALQCVVDGTLLVMDTRRTGVRRLERALAAIRDVSGKVFGVALTKDAKHGGTYGRRRTRDEDETIDTSEEAESLSPVGLTALDGSDTRASAQGAWG